MGQLPFKTGQVVFFFVGAGGQLKQITPKLVLTLITVILFTL